LIANDTDRDWKKWGKENPYFGVVSHSEFLNGNLSDDSLLEFFASGQRHADHVIETIRESISPTFAPTQVLDYGCGVGRIVFPFAKYARTVVGVDISPDMLNEARANGNKFGVTSSRFLHVDEMDSLEPRSFDLVHSFIVFQHIPVARGEQILRKLITLLVDGGVGAVHFTFSDRRPALRRRISALRRRVGLVNGALNLLSRKSFSTPTMQMNNYSINRIFDILIDSHCSNVHVEFSNHSLHLGAMIYFQRHSRPLL
jgi:SAM-dependent methyltransferase